MRKWEGFLWLWKSTLFMITLAAWRTWAFLHEDLMKEEILVCNSGKHHRMSSRVMPSLLMRIIIPFDIHCVYLFFFKKKNVTQDSKLQDRFWTVTRVLRIKMLLEITDQKASLTPSLLFSMHPPASQPSPPTGSVPQCVTHTHANINTHTYNHAHMYVCIHIIISLFAAAQNLACQTHGSVSSLIIYH